MLDVSARYPGQVGTADSGYPHGKAQNVTTEGDGTGTPLEQDLVNDIFGLQQSLLAEAGLTPTDTPDRVGACQQLDAIKYLADMAHLKFNVVLRGATGLGLVDESDAFTATETALADEGGGAVFLPPGTYLLPATWVKNPKVDWVAIDGTVTVKVYGAPGVYGEIFNITAGTNGHELLIQGIDFEADADNTGVLFSDPTIVSGAVLLRFRRCRFNKNSSHLKGKIAYLGAIGSRLTFEDCDTNALVTGVSAISAPYVEMTGGDATMAPAAAAPLIRGQAVAGAGMRIEKVRFHQVSTLGGIAFIKPEGGVCHINGNEFDVDASSAGLPTYGVQVNSSSEYHVNGNSWSGDAITYEFVARAKLNSQFQLHPYNQVAGSGSIPIPPGTGVALIEITGDTAPNIDIAEALADGHDFTLCVKNIHGSGTWAGVVTFTGVDTLLIDHVSAAPLLANGEAVIYRFSAITSGLISYWMQVAQALVIN